MVHLASQLKKIKWGNNRRIWEEAYTHWHSSMEAQMHCEIQMNSHNIISMDPKYKINQKKVFPG